MNCCTTAPSIPQKRTWIPACPLAKQHSNFAFSRQFLIYFCFDLVGRQLAFGLVHQTNENWKLFALQENLFVLNNHKDLFSSPDAPGKYSMHDVTLFSLSSAWVLDFLAAGKSGESHCTSKVHYKRVTGLPKNLLSYHHRKYWPHEKVAINNDPSIQRINHNTIPYIFEDTCE